MLAPWPIGDKRTCRSDLCNNAVLAKCKMQSRISSADDQPTPSPLTTSALSCFDPITHHVYTAINRTGKEPIEAQKDKITATTFAHLAPYKRPIAETNATTAITTASETAPRRGVHYFLRDNGLDDGLIFDREEMLESLSEIPKL